MNAGRRDAESPAWTKMLIDTKLYRNLAIYCAGAVLFIAISVLLWFQTKEASFFHQVLAPTLLGSAVTALAAFASLVIIASREIQERRELNALQQTLGAARPSLRLGNLTIEDIRIVAAGNQLDRRFRFDVIYPHGAPLPRRADPPEWPRIEEKLLPVLRSRAAEQRQVFFDDEKLDLLDAVRRRDLEDGQPLSIFELTVGATTYFRFAAMSNALDEDVSGIIAGATTLRSRWGNEPQAPEHVSSLPAPATLGCGVVVITNDKQVVLLERSATYVGGPLPGDRRTSVHVVAEGMIPADLTRDSSPLRAAALRALDEELGIDVSGPGIEPLASLDMVGMFFDTRRWQPCFVWTAQVSISLDELATMQTLARDGWETAGLYGVPFDIRADATRALLLNQHQSFVAATNHASACLILALVANQGLVICRAALSWGVGRSRRMQGPDFRMSAQDESP